MVKEVTRGILNQLSFQLMMPKRCYSTLLTLYVISTHRWTITMESIIKCSQLEELSMKFQCAEKTEDGEDVRLPDFDKQHQILSCSKLRIVSLKYYSIEDDNIHSLLMLPNLEKLLVGRSLQGFQLMKPVSEVKKLTDFVICFDPRIYVDTKRFCNAVKMMPKLQNLDIRRVCDDKDKLEIACEVIVIATSRGKDVIIDAFYGEDDDDFNYNMIGHMRIERKHIVSDVDEIFNLVFDNISSRTFWDDVKTFVNKKLKNHHAYLISDE